MKNNKKLVDSKFVKSAILGISGLVAISLAGVIVYILGLTFNLKFLSDPFTDELLMTLKFPFFFILCIIVKIIIGGKLIELLVKYISKLLGIKKIIIDPDKPLIVVKKK